MRSSPRGGVDVFLDNLPSRNLVASIATSAFDAVDVTSRSWQFLDSTRVRNLAGFTVERWPTVLEGVRHRCAYGGAQAPPSIEWCDPGVRYGTGSVPDLVVGGQLTMIGCTFAGSTASGSPSGAVAVSPEVVLVAHVGCVVESGGPLVYQRRSSVSVAYDVVVPGAGSFLRAMS